MASVDFESVWIWLQAAVSEGAVREGLAVGLATFVVVMVLGQRVSGRRKRDTDTLRERIRELELQIEAARGEVAAARKAHGELQNGDPEVYVRALAAAVTEEGPNARKLAPETWLDPLRPALAETYLRLARGVLGKVKGEDDLERARTMAWGAMAAAPERKECADLLARIDEAERLGLFRELSEADALAWRIARQDLDDFEGAGKHGLISRSRGPIGYTIFLSGWEADELHEAALAELGGRVDGADGFQEAAGAQEAGTGRAGAGRQGDVVAESARVVAISNGAAAEDEEEAEAARAVGSDSRRRGKTVMMMPVGRGGARGGPGDGTDDVAKDGPGEDAADTSERELGLKRLWERRRRPDMLGETHPRTLAARANMGHEAGRLGRHNAAEAVFREVLEAMIKPDVMGEHEHETLTVRHNLGTELLKLGHLDQAEAEFKIVLGELGSPAGRGRNDPLALAAAHGLAEVWSARGKQSEAEAAFGAVWRARSADPGYGPDHPHTLWTRVRMLRAAEAAAAAD
ncbi:MAG: tetratricopeptide repeat protein [Paracoccaceae bacterium]|nr:tetratricopeptide repeat protein [Paracoccaceae bacterium]